MIDIKFGCPNCGSEWKHLAGMTFGEVLSLRHDKERLTLQVTCLRAYLAAVTAERDRMREALKPFADAADDFIAEKHDAHRAIVTLGDLRRARAALEGVTEPVTGDSNA